METINKTVNVFQTDSECVREVYERQPNYLIEYDERATDKPLCAVYFCSNDIYYPNTEAIFRKRMIEGNFFEWYGTRIKNACKHIFLRDVFKQWYLCGINRNIDSPEKLTELLREETQGFDIFMVGSSAGAYAAIFYGSLLQAKRVIAFNPQFELNSLLTRSSEEINPLIFRLKDTERRKYYDILPFINRDGNNQIYYFYSNRSQWDVEQHAHLGLTEGVMQIPFNSNHHGIPFLKVALMPVLNMNDVQLRHIVGKVQHPLWFTIKMAGVWKTLYGFVSQLYKAYKKRH